MKVTQEQYQTVYAILQLQFKLKNMKKFNLYGTVTISIYTEVEANSIEEAKEIAERRSIEGYRWGDKTQKQQAWVADEYDGEPNNIRNEDEEE